MGRYTIARALQFAGMCSLPVLMTMQIMNDITVAQMLVMSVAGVLIFYVGRALQPPR